MAKLENHALWIKRARLSFPNLLQPRAATQGGEPKYGANFILEPTDPEWKEMGEIIVALATEKWAENAAGIINMMKGDKRLRCYGQGEEKLDKQGNIYDGFSGKVWISANNADKPVLYGTDAQELPPTANANQLFVGGNWVSAVVRFWPQDNRHGRAIRAQLEGVQFLEQGEHFGSAPMDTSGIFQAVPGAPAPTAPVPGQAPVAPTPQPTTGGNPTPPAQGVIDPLS